MSALREIELKGQKFQVIAGEIVPARDQVILRGSRISITLPNPPIRYYRHGWQSLSLAAWTHPGPLPVQRPAILHPFQQDPAYAKESLPNGSWLGAVELEQGRVLLLGALGLDTHVRLKGDLLEGWSEAGPVEWLITFGSETSVFEEYTRQLREIFGISEKKSVPKVWCSWYGFYADISQESLLSVFNGLNDFPFDVIQIDDGWQREIGIWEPNSKFPSGMDSLAERIRLTGRRAGLWLAPLVAVSSSLLFREHSHWFLKDGRGHPVSAGFNWGQRLHALDTTHPEVLDWLDALMKKVRGWGFDYIKLDLLYAGALPGRRYRAMPREAAYRKGLQVMRAALEPDVYLLASMAPIIPSLGNCDALRIGPDVAGHWENWRDAVILANPTTPGVRNAIRTSLHRLWLDGLVQLDPDVAYFGSKGNDLTPVQKQYQQDVARICGFRATSDLPHQLSALERDTMKAYLEDVQKPTRTGRYTFRLGNRTVDFSEVVGLPVPARGLSRVQMSALSWLAELPWVLRFNEILAKRARQESSKRD